MLYLGIDQHARQLTVSLCDEHGDVVQARQVSTQPAKVNEFFEQLTRGRDFSLLKHTSLRRSHQRHYRQPHSLQ